MPKIDESRKRKMEEAGGSTKKAKIETEVYRCNGDQFYQTRGLKYRFTCDL